MNPSKPSHTFAHFCPLQALRKWSRKRLRDSFPLRCSEKWWKSRFLSIFVRFGFQNGSNMAPQKSPKIDQKPGKSMLNPPKPTSQSKTVHRPRKSFKMGPTWLPKTRPKLKKNLESYVKSAKAHIAFQNCPQTPKILPKYPHHHAKIMPKSYQILTIIMPVSCQNQATIIPRSCQNPRNIIPKACKRLTIFQPMLGNIWQKSYPNHTKFIPKSFQNHTKIMP